MDEKPDSCECCQFETENLEHYFEGDTTYNDVWLCQFCAGGEAGNYTAGAHDARGVLPVLKAINYAANVLLQAISERSRVGGYTNTEREG